MAFPGTLNINYYKGDTYEFRIYPKDSTGAVFNLAPYGNVAFTISTARGSAGVANKVEAYAEVSNDKTYVLCRIAPAVGLQLNATGGTPYVYDVEIKNNNTTPPTVYTLITGTISVTDHITGATA